MKKRVSRQAARPGVLSRPSWAAGLGGVLMAISMSAASAGGVPASEPAAAAPAGQAGQASSHKTRHTVSRGPVKRQDYPTGPQQPVKKLR